MKKLLTLFTLLLTVCSGAWGVTPVTKTYGTQTYLDVANTTKNVTVETTNYVTLLRSDYSGVNTWYKGGSSNTGNIAGSFDANTMPGFLSGSGWNEGLSIKNSSGYIRPFFVTGTTGVAILGNDNNNSDRILKIVIEEVSEDGTLTPVGSKNGGNGDNSKSYMLDYGNTLSANKYYKITVTSDASSNSRFAQIRFTQPSAPAGVTNPSFSVDAGSSIVKNTANAVTLTSAGNTIYYKWNASDVEYATSADFAAAAEGNGPSPVYVTAPNATGATYLYAVAKDGEGKYSNVVKRSYTITNPSYTVTLNTNGGTINAGNVTEYVEGTGATLPTNVTKDCYTFAGWYDNSGLTGVAVATISTEATGNKEYWAKWTPKYATSLNFQAVVEAGTQASNPIATFLSNANMEHSTFSSSVWETGDAPSSEYVGFKLKDNGAYVKFLVKAGKEVTITLGNIAQTLELYKNGVKTNIAASTGAGVQTVVPAFTPAEDMLVELRTTNTGTVTLKKIIIDEPIAKFNVTYKANGSGEADVLNNVSKVDENMFTYTGHAFTGWNTEADGNGDDYAVGADVTSTLTLYAQWISTYTVEFNLQGHGSAIDAQEVAEGGKVTEPTAPTADGWVFGGWYEESTCENEFDFNTTINADKTLYAKWTEDVKVTFFSVGGWSSSTNSSDWSGKDNIDVEIEGLNITGGTASAVSIESSKTCATTGSGASMAYSLGFNSVALKISLTDNQLKAGDVITITSNASHNNAFIITNTNNRSSSVSATATSGVAEYVVSESDILNDMSTIYIWRLSSTVNIKTLTISRSAANVTVSNLGIEGEKDYATMYYGTVAMAVPAGVKAKTYKVVDGKLTVSRTYENGSIYDVIPAGEAVVLEADVDANTPYMFSVSSTTTEPDGDNLLRGTDVAQTINTAGYKYYKLAKNNAGTKVGFYYAVEDGVSITNGAHKAYLAVPTGSGEAKEYFVLGGEDETSSEATAISAVEIEIANGATLYNLAGQKVGKDYKGIIVVNGKKYVRK